MMGISHWALGKWCNKKADVGCTGFLKHYGNRKIKYPFSAGRAASRLGFHPGTLVLGLVRPHFKQVH
jgi:hypothetical protein